MPAVVALAVCDAVQEQVAENRRRARIPQQGSRYLLHGLLVCAQCGYAYHAVPLMRARPITRLPTFTRKSGEPAFGEYHTLRSTRCFRSMLYRKQSFRPWRQPIL